MAGVLHKGNSTKEERLIEQLHDLSKRFASVSNSLQVARYEAKKLKDAKFKAWVEIHNLQIENQNLNSSLHSAKHQLSQGEAFYQEQAEELKESRVLINKQNDQIGNMKEELEKLQSFRDVVIAGLDANRSDYDKDMAAWNPEED